LLRTASSRNSGGFRSSRVDEKGILKEANSFPDLPQEGIYTPEALKAVGWGFSPLVARRPVGEVPRIINFRPFSLKESKLSYYSKNEEQKLFAEILVLRAWDLVECLGGTHPYVSMKFNVSTLVVKTSTLFNSTSPVFNEIVVLDSTGIEKAASFAVPSSIQFFIMNKNNSLSDEVIGTTELFLSEEVEESQHSAVLALADTRGDPAGFLEIRMKIVL
jgi:hypothetical protein